MRPARSRLVLFSATILAALAAVLAVVLPAWATSPSAVTAAGNRVWAFSLAAPARTGAERPVSPDQRLSGAPSCPFCAPGACVAAEEAAASTAQRLAASCGGASFTASTRVMLASGAAVPIASLKPGEKVLATNVDTGKTQAEPVTAVLVHHDTNRYDLRVKTAHGTAVMQTTSTHLFWIPTSRKWMKAGALRYGAHLQTPGTAAATVLSGYVPKTSSGWMWDLTITSDHDFYVQVDAGAVLVHNCPIGPSESWGNPESLADHFAAHGADFGASSAEDYANQGSEFFQHGIQQNLPIKIDEEGIIRIYDLETNTFGAYNPSGTTRTLFSPSSPTYWLRQPGVEPWSP